MRDMTSQVTLGTFAGAFTLLRADPPDHSNGRRRRFRPAGRHNDRDRPHPPDATAERLRSTLIIGDVRTAEDDLEFSIRQHVEVALRALSPAINDPFTAMAAVDWLGAALDRLAVVEWPSRYR